MDNKKIIGYEFKGIRFYKEGGKLESELGVSSLQSADAEILFELITRKTIKKLESSEKTDIGITYVQLEQAISRIRRILWDAYKEKNNIIETIKNVKDSKGYNFIAAAEPIYNIQVISNIDEGLKTFEGWLWGPGKTISKRLFFGVILTWVITLPLVYWTNWAKLITAFLQLVIISALAYDWKNYRVKALSFFNNESQTVLDELGKITNYWFWLLVSWLLLYFFLFLKYGAESIYLSQISASASQISPAASPSGFAIAGNIFATIFNYSNTIMVVLCFTILNEEGGDEDKNSKGKYLILPAALGIITIAIYLVLPLFPDLPYKAISNAIDLFTGIVAGIVMALFVGRLQSKFFGTRPWLLIILYSYTAL
jgi:hypothetical protein